MSTENVESIPSVIINQESEQSPNKSNRSIKSSRSISPSLSYREKVTKEINESKMETIAEIANLFDIFANDQNNKSKERDNLVNAQLKALHELITHKEYFIPPTTVTPESDSCIREYINFITKKCSTLTQKYIPNKEQSKSSENSNILHDATTLHNTKTSDDDVLPPLPSPDSQSLDSAQYIPHQPAYMKPAAAIDTISKPSTTDTPLSDFSYIVLPSSIPNCRASPISGGYMQPYAPRLPLLVQLAETSHRLPYHLSYAQLVNLVPFDPGGK